MIDGLIGLIIGVPVYFFFLAGSLAHDQDFH